MKDPMMLLHMHKLWGNKKPRAILYNCFEWVMGQKHQDRLCGGLDFTHNTLFRGRTLHREPAVMLRNAFKVELGRTNSVKYSDDNNPLTHTCAGGQSRAGSWLPPSGTPRRHYRKKPGQGGRDGTRRPGGTICPPRFYLSTHYLLRFGVVTSGHSSLCSRHAKHRGISISCGHPGAAGTHVERRVHAITHTSSPSVTAHRHTDDGFDPNTRAPRLILIYALRVRPESAFSLLVQQ